MVRWLLTQRGEEGDARQLPRRACVPVGHLLKRNNVGTQLSTNCGRLVSENKGLRSLMLYDPIQMELSEREAGVLVSQDTGDLSQQPRLQW